jgi:hypothetical protein
MALLCLRHAGKEQGDLRHQQSQALLMALHLHAICRSDVEA